MNAAISRAEQNSIQSRQITTILAFASVYIIWGSTYFAIRFLLAGGILFAYVLIRRMVLPSALKGISGGSHSVTPYLVMMASQICWSVGTLMTKNMALPASKMVGSAAQMGLGGLMLLLLSAGAGEMQPFPVVCLEAWRPILYLTIAGSVVAFTAYVWLLGHFPATTVGSYAYVNPVVALALGYWFGKESIDWRVFAGTFLVLAGVVLILRGNRGVH